MAFNELNKLCIVFFLALMMSGCISVGDKSAKIKETPISVHVDDGDVLEKKDYSMFFDEGDHFEELVEEGYFRQAARLYDKYHDSFFQEKKFFSGKTNKEIYADYFDLIAKHLNDHFNKKILNDQSKLDLYTRWPLPQERWNDVKKDLTIAEERLNVYNSFQLLQEKQYRLDDIDKLDLQKNETYHNLKAYANDSFRQYDLLNGKNFFNQYPANIKDKSGLIAIEQDHILTKLKSASSDDLSIFNNIYKDHTDIKLDYLVGDLYIHAFLEEQREQNETEDLSLILRAIESAQERDFSIKKIDSEQVLFVEATSRSLLESGYIDFPAEINLDLPFPYAIARYEEALSTSADSSFVIIFSVAQADIKRRIKSREKVKSEYLAGYKDVSNPGFKQAVVSLREAERGLASAQSTFCGSGTLAAGICEVAKGIAIGSWNSKLRQANQAYINTPEYIKKEVYQSYNFSLSNVEVTKSMTVNYYIIDRSNKKHFKSMFDISEEKKFKVAYSLHDDDPKLNNYKSKYDSEESIVKFEDAAVSVNLSSLMLDYVYNIDKTKEMLCEVSLLSEMLEDKNTALANYKKNEYTARPLNDSRFDNVVVIFNPEGSLGTGFYVAPNLILTNYHVVEGSKFIEMKLYNGLETFGKVVKSDVRLDLALIKVEARGEPVNFFDTNTIELGSEVVAIGHPSALEFSITRGVVSAVRKRRSVFDTGGDDILFVQTDAAISPGNSGGPLFLEDKVIGVNNQKIVADAVEGLGFAIHFSEVINFLEEDF